MKPFINAVALLLVLLHETLPNVIPHEAAFQGKDSEAFSILHRPRKPRKVPFCNLGFNRTISLGFFSILIAYFLTIDEMWPRLKLS